LKRLCRFQRIREDLKPEIPISKSERKIRNSNAVMFETCNPSRLSGATPWRGGAFWSFEFLPFGIVER
jgi:hypothetical protein